jgi:hydrogenase nickel incorporation protein HypA/HybF
MHELGIVFEVVKSVQNIVLENKLTKVEKIVLQIGEASSVVPKFMEECYPAAVDGTNLHDTKLEIEILSANAICHGCGKVFSDLLKNRECPNCHSRQWEMISGKEFIIKEIVAY